MSNLDSFFRQFEEPPQDEFDQFFQQFETGQTQAQVQPPAVTPEESSWGQDAWASFGVGSNRLLESVGTLGAALPGVEMDNALTRMGQRGAEYWNQRKSSGLQEKQQEVQRKIAEAGKEGFWSELGTAVWEHRDPELFVNFLFEQVPMMVPGLGAGRAATLATKSAAAGTKVAIGTGAGLQGADVAGETYDRLLKLPEELWQQNSEYFFRVAEGEDPEEVKKDLAGTQAAWAGTAAGGISLLTQRLPGGATLEKVGAGEQLKGNVLSRAGKGFAGEALQESTEEGLGQVVGNIGVGQVNPEQALLEGAGAATGLGALAGGTLGGIGGALSGGNQATAELNAKDQIEVADWVAGFKAKLEAAAKGGEAQITPEQVQLDQLETEVKAAEASTQETYTRAQLESEFAEVFPNLPADTQEAVKKQWEWANRMADKLGQQPEIPKVTQAPPGGAVDFARAELQETYGSRFGANEVRFWPNHKAIKQLEQDPALQAKVQQELANLEQVTTSQDSKFMLQDAQAWLTQGSTYRAYETLFNLREDAFDSGDTARILETNDLLIKLKNIVGGTVEQNPQSLPRGKVLVRFGQQYQDPRTTKYPGKLNKTLSQSNLKKYADNAKKMKALAEGFLKAYMPDASVILIPVSRNPGYKAVGEVSWTEMLGADGKNQRVYSIYIDFDNTGSSPEIPAEALAAEVLFHELGHALSFHELKNSPASVQRAVLNDYRQWLLDVSTGPGLKLSQHIEKWRSPLRGIVDNEINTGWDPLAELNSAGNENYWYSFNEFIAEQVARSMQQQGPEVNSLSLPYYRKVWLQLRDLYKKMLEKYPAFRKTYKGVDYWLDSLRYRNQELRLKQAALASNPKSTLSQNFVQSTDLTTEDSNSKEALEAKILNTAKTLSGPGKAGLSQALKDVPKFTSFMKQMFTIPQLERTFQNVPGVRTAVDAMRKFWAIKGQWTNVATDTLEFARQFNTMTRKEETKAFEKFVIATTLQSDKNGRPNTAEELQALRQDTNLSDHGFALWQRMQKDYKATLEDYYIHRKAEIARALRDKDPVAYQKALEKLEKERKTLLNRDYSPLMRFGRYAVTAIAQEDLIFENQEFKKGSTVYFEVSETEKDQQASLDWIRKTLGNKVKARPNQLDDRAQAFLGMPEFMKNQMQDAAVEAFMQEQLDQGLSAEAVAEATARYRAEIEKIFSGIALANSPGASFGKRLLHRKGTPGFSMDAIRAYASYMQSYANFTSRLQTRHEILSGIEQIKQTAYRQSEGLDAKTANSLDRLWQYLDKHYIYLMNPGNEWANMRSIATVWYLGFVPRSAFVNLTQVPLATQPWLAKEFGSEVGSIKALAKAMLDLKGAWTKGRKGRAMEADLTEAIERGYTEQFLDESLASELGAYSEGSTLQRILPGWVPGGKNKEINYWIRQTQNWSMAMFQTAEKVNRLITFTAAFRMARDQALNGKKLEDLSLEEKTALLDKAFIKAREGVERTQGEYARWARPNIMKGKKSILFLFKLYMQHMVMLLATSDARWKFLRNSTLLGGVLGMPFASNMLGLIQAMANALDDDEERWDAELWLKDITTQATSPLNDWMSEHLGELGRALHVAPDLLLKGTSRYGFGLFYPFDLHSTMSLGNIVPGTDVLNRSAEYVDAYADFGRAAETIGGPAVSILFNAYRAVNSRTQNDWKVYERAMPAAMAASSRALRWATEGERNLKGQLSNEFDVHDLGHVLEIVGGTMGLTPRRISEKREFDWKEKQAEQYYNARKQTLRLQYYEAWVAKDREAIKDAMEAIQKFNRQRPPGVIGIAYQDLKQSITQRWKDKTMYELGLPPSKGNAGLYWKYRQAYPDLEFAEPSD